MHQKADSARCAKVGREGRRPESASVCALAPREGAAALRGSVVAAGFWRLEGAEMSALGRRSVKEFRGSAIFIMVSAFRC